MLFMTPSFRKFQCPTPPTPIRISSVFCLGGGGGRGGYGYSLELHIYLSFSSSIDAVCHTVLFRSQASSVNSISPLSITIF